MYTLGRPFRLAAVEAAVHIDLPPEEAVRRYHRGSNLIAWARSRFGISLTPKEDLEIAREVRGKGWWRTAKPLDEVLKRRGISLPRLLSICVEDNLRSRPEILACEGRTSVCYVVPNTFLMALRACSRSGLCEPRSLPRLPSSVDSRITSLIREGRGVLDSANEVMWEVDGKTRRDLQRYFEIDGRLLSCISRSVRLLNHSFTSAVDFCYRTHCGFSPYAPRFGGFAMLGLGLIGLLMLPGKKRR